MVLGEFQEISDLYVHQFSTPEANGELDSTGTLTLSVVNEHDGVDGFHRVAAIRLEQVGYVQGVWNLRYVEPGIYVDLEPVTIQIRVRPESHRAFERLSSSLRLILWLVRGFPHNEDQRVKSRALDLIRLVHRGSVSRDEATHQLRIASEEVDIEKYKSRVLSEQSLSDLKQSLDLFRYGSIDWPGYLEQSWDVIRRAGFGTSEHAQQLSEIRIRAARENNHPNYFAPINDIDIRQMIRRKRQHEDMVEEAWRRASQRDE